MRVRYVVSAAAGFSALCFGVVTSAQADGHGRYNWTGFYAGGHAGFAKSSSDMDNFDFVPTANLPAAAQPVGVEPKANGFFGGGQLGYNQQFNNWVAGLELSYSGANLDDTSRPSNYAPLTSNIRDDDWSTDINSVFQAVARLGFAWDNVLLYGKVGYASANVKMTGLDTGTAGGGFNQPGTTFRGNNKRHHGYVLGTGLEYAFMKNVIIGIDYSYINLKSKNHFGLRHQPNGAASVTGRGMTADIDPNIHAVTGRISYKFNSQ